MTRLAEWPEALTAYIDGRERQRFRFGKHAHDCCSFAAGAVERMTGRDPMQGVPDYTDAADADALLVRNLEDWLDERFARRPVGLARRGDVALATLNGADTVMIVEGDQLVGPGRRGLERVARSMMRACWAV